MSEKIQDRNVIYFAIYCIIVALFWIIPPIAPITTEGMHLLGIFIATVFGWTVTGHVWPSLMALLLLPFTGLVNWNGTLSLSWGSDSALFFLLLMIFVAFLNETKTTTFIVAFLMTRKFLHGHPWRTLAMIFVSCWLLALFCGSTMAIMISWGVVYKICEALGYKPFEKFSNLLVFGVAVMAALSTGAAPWASNAVFILASYTATSGEVINFLHFLAFGTPVALLSIACFLLMCKFIFKLDVSRLKNFDVNIYTKEDLALTTERKIALISLVTFVVLLILPSALPKDNAIAVILNQMGLSLKILVIMLVLGLIRVNQKPLFDFAKLAKDGVPWGMVLMFAGILAFLGLLGNDAAGISEFLRVMFTPIFAHVSAPVFLFAVLAITVILTNLMQNMVVAVIMMTATIPIAASFGISSAQVVYLITYGCTIALLLPSSGPATTVLFANREWIVPKDIYKYSIPTIIMITLVTYIWNMILFMF